MPISCAYGLDANGRALENPEARFVNGPALITPSGGGGHNWHPMSYSPLTGYVYIPVRRTFGAVANDPNYVYDPRFQNTGYGSARGLGPVPAELGRGPQGELVAWDPVAQKEVWSVPDPSNKNGGTVVTAGGLVFWGDAPGHFAAFDARDGKRLWDVDAGMPIHSGAMTYQVDGVQYVAVLTGASFLTQPRVVGLQPKSRVVVYKLGGTAKAMPYPKPDPTPKPPVIKASAEEITRGQGIFGMRSCGTCHGPGAVSSGVVPDLRRSPYIQDKDAFFSVLQGALLPNGMPEFGKLIKPEEAEALRAYLAAQAEKLYVAENKAK
ncbi:MAG: c-type cytochrome, partial [Rhodospirillaceae bacterium]